MTDYEPWAGHEFATSVAKQDRLKQRCQAMHATMQLIIDNLLDGSGNRMEYTSMRNIQQSADMLYEEACCDYTPRLERQVAKLETIIDGLIQ